MTKSEFLMSFFVSLHFSDIHHIHHNSMTESASSHGSKPIKSLPQRAPGSGTAFNTTMTLPASSDLASYLAHGQAQGRPEEATQDENWRSVDFSSFAKQHDF